MVIYFGLHSQRDLIGDCIDDIDMELIYTESRARTRKLEETRQKLCEVLNRGFGIVRF